MSHGPREGLQRSEVDLALPWRQMVIMKVDDVVQMKAADRSVRDMRTDPAVRLTDAMVPRVEPRGNRSAAEKRLQTAHLGFIWKALEIRQVLQGQHHAVLLQNRHKRLDFTEEDIQQRSAAFATNRHRSGKHPPIGPLLEIALHLRQRRTQVARRERPVEERVQRNATRMQHDRRRPHVGGKLDVALHVKPRERPLVLVETRKRIEFGIAARRGNRHGTERMDAPDGDAVQHPLEARDLVDRRMKPQLEFVESELQRLLGDLLAGLQPTIAPVRGQGKLHCGKTRRSIR